VAAAVTMATPVVRVVAKTITLTAAAKATLTAAIRAVTVLQALRPRTMLRPRLESRTRAAGLVVVTSVAAPRADPTRSLTSKRLDPRHRVNMHLVNKQRLVSMRLVNIRASRPRRPRRSLVSRTVRRRPRRAVPTSTRCGALRRPAAAARGVVRARVARSNPTRFD
jgi:hypothetical protein